MLVFSDKFNERIEDFFKAVKKQARQNLTKGTKLQRKKRTINNTKKLYNSIKYQKLFENNTGLAYGLFMQDYGDYIDKGVKGMGICLGMQILCNSSEEGENKDGLGIIKGTVKKLDSSEDKVPNMGWNKTVVEEDAQIDEKIKNILNGEYYYVHSYAVEVTNASNKIARFILG